MERSLSLKEIDLNDKRTKWIAFSVIVHLALLFSPSLKDKKDFNKLILAIPQSKVQLQLKRPVKKPVVPVVKKKPVKKLDKVARKKAVKKEVVEEKKVEQLKPINNVVTDSKVYNNFFKNYVKPNYPRILRRRGIKGQAIVEFTIEKTGELTNLKVLSTTHKLFERSAIKAISQWSFKELASKMLVRREIIFK
jgi:TonB family protein